jgi:glycerol transport system ATP-binding protein
MELRLRHIEQRVGPQVHLYPLDLRLVPLAVTVLLGATQAGKTTLMRVMAGLDAPIRGQVIADGRDVTGMPVRERNVAMVYQQFINYPSMTVADNIASPLRLRREGGIDARVQQLAAKLHIEAFLQRLPSELSGGQQHRHRTRLQAQVQPVQPDLRPHALLDALEPQLHAAPCARRPQGRLQGAIRHGSIIGIRF